MRRFDLNLGIIRAHAAFGQLSPKQRRFVEGLGSGMSPTASAQLAFDANRKSAATIASKLLKNPGIRELLDAGSPVPEISPCPATPDALDELRKCGVPGCEERYQYSINGVRRCGVHYGQEEEAKQQAIMQRALERQAEERARSEQEADKLRTAIKQSEWTNTMVLGASGRVLDLEPDNGNPVIKALNDRLTNEFWNPGSERKNAPRDWENDR